jgi:hypothetical protein
LAGYDVVWQSLAPLFRRPDESVVPTQVSDDLAILADFFGLPLLSALKGKQS